MKKVLQFLLIALFWLPNSTPVQAAGRFETLIDSARTARADGAYLKAAQLLLKAYQMNPNPVLLNNIGKMYEEAGKYKKAYEAYKSVADDPDAPSDLRPMNISRMNGIQDKLSKGHLIIIGTKPVAKVRIDDEDVDKTIFHIERSLALGKYAVEFKKKKSKRIYISWVSMVAGERKTIRLKRIQKAAKAKITALNLAGISEIRINGYTVHHRNSSSILLKPATYLIELEFKDGAVYERTVSLKKGTNLAVDDFATTFTEMQAPDSTQSDPKFWYKGGAVALGVGLTTAGGLLALNASDTHNQILGNPSLSMVEAKQEWDNAQTRGDRGLGLMGIGLTALTSGILWFALDPHEKQERGAWEWFPSPLLAPVYAQPNASLKLNQVQ